MKKLLPLIIILSVRCQLLFNQTVVPQGHPVAEIFTDFHYIFNDTSKRTGFDLNRAHLGYNYKPEGNFSGTIIVNIGSPVDLAAGSKPRRYAYFREASILYSKNNMNLFFGLVSTRIFDFQQKFWGKRYLSPEFQSLYGYGSVADLGVVMDYKISDIVKVDLSLLNGEGYINIQVDNSLKSAFGITISLPCRLYFRQYADFLRSEGVWQATLITFAGIKREIVSFGAEASFKSNIDLTEGHNVWGISATGSLFPDKKYEIFTRIDYSASVHLTGEELQWDYKLDGVYLISGVQRNFTDNIKLSLNYRGVFPYNPEKENSSAIFLNALFRF